VIVAGNIELLRSASQSCRPTTSTSMRRSRFSAVGWPFGSARPEGTEDAGGNFDPGFRIALHHKDLGIVTAARGKQVW